MRTAVWSATSQRPVSDLLRSFRRNAVHVRQALELLEQPSGPRQVDSGYLQDEGLLERYKRLSIPVRRALNAKDRAALAPTLAALESWSPPPDTLEAAGRAWRTLSGELDTTVVLGGTKVQRRHGLRHLLQNSVVALLITWYVGDVGALAAAAPTAILQAKYSRDFEREADDYAAESLRQNGIPLSHLADILLRLEQSHGGSSATSYLSSHPAAAERLERLRR